MKSDVTIRIAELSDAETMVKAMRVESLQNFSFFDSDVTVERQRSYLEKVRVSQRDELFVIIWRDQIIGTCGLHEIDHDNHNARIGSMIFSPEFRSKGLGAAAIRQLVTLGFGEYKMCKLYLKVFAENTVSCTKYAHLGFQFEARLRRHYLLKGEYHDMAVMSVFADEWEQ
jgi:RimJ/RimL family protein N-acetyltransferase